MTLRRSVGCGTAPTRRPRHDDARPSFGVEERPERPERDPLSVRLSRIRHLSGTPAFLAVGPTRAVPPGSSWGTGVLRPSRLRAPK